MKSISKQTKYSSIFSSENVKKTKLKVNKYNKQTYKLIKKCIDLIIEVFPTHMNSDINKRKWRNEMKIVAIRPHRLTFF